jgi:2-dehydro-3-deoxyphosphogalactonate aldolase
MEPLALLRQRVLVQMPLIAILRGIEPSEVLEVAAGLREAGFLSLEIPLNSPDPLLSISRVRQHFDGQLTIGAGTVMTTGEVEAAHAVGAQFVVSPNTNQLVIHATKALGLLSIPGFTTPTEAFAALEAGADALKLFPAEASSPSVLRALKAVLPPSCPVFPVGGITPESMAAYFAAGATGFGIGSALYQPGVQVDIVRERALAFVRAWRILRR